jgi:CheY-like chemotaxis protein
MPLDLGDVSADPRVETTLDLSGCRLVVVDDNQDAADSLALVLAGSGGDVRTAYDGDSGLRLIQSFPARRRPARHRHARHRRLQRVPAHPRGRSRSADHPGRAHRLRPGARPGAALTAGFDAHLTKPADVAALHGALAHVCPRRVR